MNHSARWKYLLILTAVMLSLTFVMPNFYGESPAIQIMPIKAGEKIDTSLLQSIETTLDKSGIINTGLILENFHIKVKLKTAEDQLKAKSLIPKSALLLHESLRLASGFQTSHRTLRDSIPVRASAHVLQPT